LPWCTTQTFTITVRPGPALRNIRSRSICNNTEFADTARSTAQGTIFSWTRRFVEGIRNITVSRQDSIIKETLRNDTDLPIDVYYVLTLSTGGSDCQTQDSIRVTVNPTPGINDLSNQTFCNGAFVRNGILFSSPSPNAAFSWTNNNPAIGLDAGGSGNLPPFIARNTTNSAITATITVFVKASSDSCAGATSKTFTITVLPGPALTSTKDTSVCNNASFRYTATSSAQIPTYFPGQELP
jgi:hypothetical protein